MGKVISCLRPDRQGENQVQGGGEDQVQGGGEDQVDFKYDQLKLQRVTQKELFKLAHQGNTVRVGATTDFDGRRKSYVYQDDYKGKMYYTQTPNIQYAEDELLQLRNYRDNTQTSSNVSAVPGYIYAIQET